MRFTTLCGGLCFTAQFTIFFNLINRIHRCPQNGMSDDRPQHRELHAQLFTNSVWVLLRPTVILRVFFYFISETWPPAYSPTVC